MTQSPALSFRVLLEWNGTTVLDARTTAVVAADIIRAHFADQFAGVTLARFVHGMENGRLLAEVQALEPGGRAKRLEYADSSGSACAAVQRLADPPPPNPGMADSYVRQCVEGLAGASPMEAVQAAAWDLYCAGRGSRSAKAHDAWDRLGSAFVAHNGAPLGFQGPLNPEGPVYGPHVDERARADCERASAEGEA